MFVHPLTKIGAAVLSLGHPPKATNRQGESYSYGAAGWLNDVDGVGYRMVASKTPISKGAKDPVPYTSSKTDTAKSNGGANSNRIKKWPGGTWASS